MLKSLLQISLFVILGIGVASSAKAQVLISLPDNLISNSESVFSVGIELSNVNSDSISGFTFVIKYDQEKIFIDDFTKTDLSSDFFVQDNNQDQGIYRITAASSTPINENGTLVQLNATVIDTGMTRLNFVSANLNEGNPEVLTENGKLLIWNEEYSPEPLQPENDATDTDTTVTLVWKPNPFYQLYEVQFSELEDFNPTLVYSNIQDSTLVINGLEFNATYYWRVKGYSFFQSTPFSGSNTFTTTDKANTPPKLSSPIEDLTIGEDFGSIEVAFLDTVITDQETSQLSFEVSSTNRYTTYSVENRNLLLYSRQDQFGTDTLVVKGLDEKEMFALDTILVQVQPINDSPYLIEEFPNQLSFSINKTNETFRISEYVFDVDHKIDQLRLVELSVPDFVRYNFDVNTDEFSISVSETDAIETFSFQVSDVQGASSENVDIVIEMVITNSEIESEKVLEFELYQNFPNPFNPSTKIDYSIPAPSRVTLEIMNTLGQRIAVIVDEHKAVGRYSVHFDASNLVSGVYMYRLVSANNTQIRKMVVIK